MEAGVPVATRQGGAATIDGAAVRALEAALRGPLLTPASAGYEEARRVWNGLVDRHPALIARCRDERDVAAAVRFANEHDVLVSVRGGGHNVAGRAVADGALVVDLSEMRGVRVDAAARLVRVQGGAKLSDIDGATLPLGLAVPLGLVGATGVAGLALHGGYGWLSRKHGLTCDNLLAAQVVLADGRSVRADERENADLLWALRGGGGNFGVVTEFEFRLHPIPAQVWTSVVFYALDRAEAVLRGWRDAVRQAPEELGTLATLWSAPDTPELPAEARGAPIAGIVACWSGPTADGPAALRPLRELATPLLDLSGPQPFAQLQRFFDADYPDGDLYYWKGLYLRELTDEVIATLVGHAWERPSARTSIDLWWLGGAPGRVAPGAAAFARRAAPWLAAVESNWTDAARVRDNVDWTRATHEDLERFGQAGAYLNFPGFAEEPERLLEAAYGANLARLKTLKARYDPQNVFSGNFNIAPA